MIFFNLNANIILIKLDSQPDNHYWKYITSHAKAILSTPDKNLDNNVKIYNVMLNNIVTNL